MCVRRSSLKKVSIITDSIACLTRQQAQQYGIGVIPINILFEGKVYRDWVDITPTEAYQLFLKNPDAFATSAPAPGECITAYRQASERGESVFCITVSIKLSSTYGVAQIAKEYAAKEIPGLKIEVMDSLTATAAEGLIVLAAAKAAEDGAELEEVIRIAKKVRDSVNVYVLLDTLRHVYRSGRVPKVASQAGTLFNIRALFSVHEKVHLAGIVRSQERGIKLMFGRIKDKVDGKAINAAVMHAYAPEAAEKLKDSVARNFNCRDLWVTEFSPVMGYATGTGTLGVAFYSED
jgi:fatty acid kinase fatty acid binding subunit